MVHNDQSVPGIPHRDLTDVAPTPRLVHAPPRPPAVGL